MNEHITVIGSINMDLVIQSPRMPKPGETITGGEFHVIPGGKGANQAVAAARQGAHVTLIGRIGNDDFGRRQQQCLEGEQIDLSYLGVDSDYSTGVAMIIVDTAGQNTIIVSRGANGQITPPQIAAAQDAILNADLLICQLEIPLDAVRHAIDIAHTHSIPVILNPAPAQPLERAVFKQITYLIPNEHEASLLSGIEVKDIPSAQDAARQLQSFGAPTVIVTLGDQGALLADAGACVHIPAVPVKVMDTTAAGDVFVGSFAVALTEGKSVRDAVTFAIHAAALSVTKLGAQSSIPTRRDVERFIT